MTDEAGGCGVDDDSVADALDRRPSRPPDYEAENRALRDLAEALADRPEQVLNRLTEAAMALTRSDGAALGLVVPGAPEGMLRWAATAGILADGYLPETCRCADEFGVDRVVLSDSAEHVFPAIGEGLGRIHENLLAPFRTEGVPAGGLWVVRRSPNGRYEREDARILDSLARFASASRRMMRAIESEESSGQRYRSLFEAMDEGFYLAEALFDAEGRCIDIFYHDENPAAIRQAIATKNLFEFEHRVRLADGSVGWTFPRAVPILIPDGEIAAWFGAATDVTERRNAAEKLAESEERYRLIVDNARDYAIFTTDTDGIIDQWHEGAANVFGWSAEEIGGRSVDETFTPEDVASGESKKERRQALTQGAAPDVRWHVRKDGSRVFIDGVATALRNGAGQPIGVLKIGQDVTERRRSEEHQRTLLAELQHRVRNTLSVIRSIARRTAGSSETVEEMAMHLDGRIGAFSRVQSVVTRDPGAGVDLASLIEDELLAHAAREGEALKISGPRVALSARAAETISLAVHELATNAVKYGALASDRGRIKVTWEWRSSEGGADCLHLSWSEAGVSDLTEPDHRGFGLELLLRALPYELGGETAVKFRPTGLLFTMKMPRSGMIMSDDASGGR